jgi:hypothetical protein
MVAVMSGLFSSPPDPVHPVPSASQQRADELAQRERDRSENDRVSGIQKQLAQETIFRNRGFGLRSLLGPLGQGTRNYLGSG